MVCFAMHIPVMPKEVLEHLSLKEGDCVLDCTFGLGGHSRQMLERISASGRLIGIDRDESALKMAAQNLAEFSSQVSLAHSDYRYLDTVLARLEICEVDAILFDLGISSFQLDDALRGFSFGKEGPLDMRMDPQSPISAYDLVNSLSEHEIALILRNFGEERFSQRIARYLVEQRKVQPIETTQELRDIVLNAIPIRYQRGKIHPATRTFQAFRIAVNRELEALDVALEKSLSALRIGGRVCVISFHSLEDRIVKQKFKMWAARAEARIITKKPLRATDAEVHVNPRSRSARLRVMERIK